MTKEIIVYSYATIVACFAVLLHAINNAPEGYQDERGFHYGAPHDR